MSMITVWGKPLAPYVKIHHEDCVVGMKKLHSESVHLTLTSPPYYNAKEYSHWETYEKYLQFLESVFTEVFRVTVKGRMCVVNVSPVIVARSSRSSESKRLPIPFHLFSIMEKIGWVYLEDIVWKKPEGSAKNRNGGFFQHRKPVAYKPNIVTETIFVFQKPDDFLIDKTVRSYSEKVINASLVKGEYERTNVWEINPITRSEHPAPFPIELADKVVKYYSFELDVVLDPFLGSGTTALSSLRHRRIGLGFEIHKEYVELAKERISRYEKKL